MYLAPEQIYVTRQLGITFFFRLSQYIQTPGRATAAGDAPEYRRDLSTMHLCRR